MEPTIRFLEVRNLFGKKNFSLSFRNNVQIYIGENGLGKTTILNILYFLLSGKYEELSRVNFDSIKIDIEGDVFDFEKNDVNNYVRTHTAAVHRSSFYTRLNDLLTNKHITALRKIISSSKEEMQKMFDVKDYLDTNVSKVNAPVSLIYENVERILDEKSDSKIFDNFVRRVKEIDRRIIYLPTFRRIEKRLFREKRSIRSSDAISFYSESDEERLLSQFSEDIHFGMRDVDDLIKSVLGSISQISRQGLDRMSTDLLKREVAAERGIEIRFSKRDLEKIEIIINRQQLGLTEGERKTILSLIQGGGIYDGNHQLLLYHLSKLIEVYNSYEKYDQGIRNFVEVCNGYLADKEFVYDEKSLSIDLMSKEFVKNEHFKEVLDLDVLSSGEKQMISIFATVYLVIGKPFIMLIDEPELSLSIFWQRKFLADISKSEMCDFLFAVTHSPFIFDNKLDAYTTGMEEFMKEASNDDKGTV